MSLQAIFRQHNTDKHLHYYGPFYEKYLGYRKNQAQKVLEIGIENGYSLRAWREFFPAATIFGIDHVEESLVEDVRICSFKADQDDRRSLAAARSFIGGNLDLVVDDGGHQMSQQVRTLAEFFPDLVPGGVYIVEDLHTSFSSTYGATAAGHANSTYVMLTHFQEHGIFKHDYLTDEDATHLQNHVLSFTIFSRRTGHGVAGGGKSDAMSLTAILIKKEGAYDE